MNLPAHGDAGGKVILLGEHAVVYGRPALVAGVPLRLSVDLQAGVGPRVDSDAVRDDDRPVQLLRAAARHFGIDAGELVATVRSALPPGAGFGSSAALVIATVRAVAAAAGTTLSGKALLRLGRELEATFHGQSSGVDPAAAALGGCFWYALASHAAVGGVPAHRDASDDVEPPCVGSVPLPRPLSLVVARATGPRRTGAAVGGLRERWTADRPRYDALFDRVAAIVARGTAALASGDLPALGRAFDDNQAVLAELGVSSPAIDDLVAVARRAGAFGAKLTGGGAGGAVIALAADPTSLATALAGAGATTQTLVVDATPAVAA